MRVALVGLGDIAFKAYLPLLASLDSVEPVLVTRSEVALRRASRMVRPAGAYRDLTDALAAGLDAAIVTAATAAHPMLAGAIVQAGVPCLVEKPLADSLPGAAELYERAGRAGVLLMTGFNRRFAPAYRQVADDGPWDHVVIDKSRWHRPDANPHREFADPLRAMVFDDFIHVLDTLRSLGARGSSGELITSRRAGEVHESVTVTLADGPRLAVGLMHQDAGATREVLQVTGAGRRVSVTDLALTVRSHDGATSIVPRDEWVAVAVQRGFAASLADFLARVESGTAFDPTDQLATYALCERVVTSCRR